MVGVLIFVAIFVLWDWIGELVLLVLGLGLYPLVAIAAGIGILCLAMNS